MTFESSFLIEVGKVAVFIVIAAFLLLGSLWLRFKFPVDENGCPLNIDPFDFRKDLRNAENDSNTVLECGESKLQGGKSRAGSQKEKQEKVN